MVSDLLQSSITAIKVESRYGPTIQLDDPFQPGPPSPLLQALKPKITLETAAGPVEIKPYGDPGETLWPIIAIVLAVSALGLAAWLFLRKR